MDERFTRGDSGAPKSDASNATVAVNRSGIERIQRLKTLVVSVRAGRAIRHVRVVKSDGPEDTVFQSLFKGSPMSDNNVLVCNGFTHEVTRRYSPVDLRKAEDGLLIRNGQVASN